MISATHAQGTDLRPARNTDLVSLVQSQSRRNAELTRQLTNVRKDVDGLAARGNEQSDARSEVSREARRVGLTAVTGPAVTVTLDDAPSSVAANGIEPDLLVVHQQDIQAVVNALWSGGAEAMTIQGAAGDLDHCGQVRWQHGRAARHPVRARRTRLARSATKHGCTLLLPASEPIQIYQQYVAAYGLVFREKSEPRLELPAHEGSLDLVHARAVHPVSACASNSGCSLGENDRVPAVKILVIDNYDSFVYNLVQYLAQIGAEVDVWRNDDSRFDDPDFADGFDGILLSPGPGTPEEAGVCVEVVRTQAGRLPIFGVCLGLQAIGVAYGGVVDRAPELLHGKTSLIHHDGTRRARRPAVTIHRDPLPLAGHRARRHCRRSWRSRQPRRSGVIMAIRHRELPVEAVQFHPESVLTEWGYQMLANWLTICGDAGGSRARCRHGPANVGTLTIPADPRREESHHALRHRRNREQRAHRALLRGPRLRPAGRADSRLPSRTAPRGRSRPRSCWMPASG